MSIVRRTAASIPGLCGVQGYISSLQCETRDPKWMLDFISASQFKSWPRSDIGRISGKISQRKNDAYAACGISVIRTPARCSWPANRWLMFRRSSGTKAPKSRCAFTRIGSPGRSVQRRMHSIPDPQKIRRKCRPDAGDELSGCCKSFVFMEPARRLELRTY
jgi:hypothetical protein